MFRNAIMEPRSGLEPETSSLPWMRSTHVHVSRVGAMAHRLRPKTAGNIRIVAYSRGRAKTMALSDYFSVST